MPCHFNMGRHLFFNGIFIHLNSILSLIFWHTLCLLELQISY